MITYYKLIKNLKTIFEQDTKVSTVVTGDSTEIDNYKKNIFPLVHISVIDSPFLGLANTAVTRYNVEVTVVDIRDVNKEADRDKFWKNDNRHDNWNTTRGILKTAENKLIKDKEGNDITINSAGAAEPLSYSHGNLLDGWQQTWTIDVPDDYTTVCDSLAIISHDPSGNIASGSDVPTLTFYFNDNITLNTGNLNLLYEGDFFGDFTESDMVVDGNVLTVTVNKLSVPTGNYYSLIDAGLVSSSTGSFLGVTDTTELSFDAI